MKPSYNIMLNSVNGVGVLISDRTYSFDPNLLPEGEYSVTFAFVSSTCDCGLPRAGLIYCDLGQSNIYEAKTTTFNNSNLIGIIKPNEKNGASFIRTMVRENPALHLKSRPNKNTINILLKADDGINAFLAGTAELTRYVLTLHFQLL